jgi:hypothetical protein
LSSLASATQSFAGILVPAHFPLFMKYFVLKRGEILGPFLREDLLAQIEGNVFDESDLGQIEGSAHWTPLRLLLHGDAATVMEGGAIAPDWRTLGTWAFRRARHLVQSDPFRGGFFFFGIGAGTLLLSYWPAALWLPWFAVAVYAGILLFRRGAAGNATLLLGCILVAVAVGFATLRALPR